MQDFPVKDGQTFLCIGDSITDCGRRAEAAPLGNGYVSLFVEMVTAHYPERNIRFINKGTGGNRVTALRERWLDDVIPNDPDWLSVMIGINDLHSYLGDPAAGVSPEKYREDYDWILGQTVEKTSAQLVLLTPFYVSVDGSGDTFRSQVMGLIPRYIEIVHEMSEKYSTKLVETHNIFQRHLKFRESETFCPEPVHPNRAGHTVIAMALMDALTK